MLYGYIIIVQEELGVEFYSSSDPGPLGKPSAKKISNAEGELKNWDPTDPNPNNPWKNYKEQTNKDTNKTAYSYIYRQQNFALNEVWENYKNKHSKKMEKELAQLEKDYAVLQDDFSKEQIINEIDKDIQPLTLKTHQHLKVWQIFLNEIKKHNRKIPRFPIWAMEFDADYDYEDIAPFKQHKNKLKGHKGKLGWVIDGPSKEDCLKQLPIYAQTDTAERFPEWKIRYIRQNREFWADNSDWLSLWIEYIKEWDNSHQKFEWNCKGCEDGNIRDKIVQFRASGIRVKLPTFSPALNLVGTQVPILPWVKLPSECIPKYSDAELEQYGLTREDISYGRYLSVKEAAALQGMGQLKFGNLSKTRIYEALGNAINVDIVKIIAKKMLSYE